MAGALPLLIGGAGIAGHIYQNGGLLGGGRRSLPPGPALLQGKINMGAQNNQRPLLTIGPDGKLRYGDNIVPGQ